MAKEHFLTPACSVRWAKLITPELGLDRDKPPAWSCDLVLDNANPEHVKFLDSLKAQNKLAHGNAKLSTKTPWKPDKEYPDIATIVRFKMPQFTRKDGTVSDGPRIVDAKKHPWDGSAIGNDSVIRISFTIYAWSAVDGAGITLQPAAVQVLQFVPYESYDATEDFGEEEGFSLEDDLEDDGGLF